MTTATARDATLAAAKEKSMTELIPYKTFDQLVIENKLFLECIVVAEADIRYLRQKMQANDEEIKRQLDDMASDNGDCTLCMGPCE